MRGGADHRPAADRGRARPRARAAVAAALSLSLGALALPPSGALAADWSITGNVSERIEADTNRDLDGSPSPVYGSSTRLGLNFTGATPTTEWEILTGVTGSVFGGPGKDETDDDLNRVDPSVAASIAHNGKYLDTGASFFFDMAPASFAQLEETGITEDDATQLTVQLAADAAYALDPRNRVRLAGYGRIVRFTEDTTTLEPITTYGGTLSWLRDLSAETQGSLTLGVRRFTSDSDTDPESVTSDLSVGINHAVNRRLSFGGTLGISATRTTETIAGQRDTDFTIGAVAGLDATWAPEPDTELTFAFSHGLEPSTIGELQTTTSVGVGLQHVINERVSAGVAVALQRRREGGGFESGEDRDFVRISPSIAFQLTPDWALQAGYALTADRESDEGEALSNRVFLTVTREFDVLP